jgi:hypothetical protein
MIKAAAVPGAQITRICTVVCQADHDGTAMHIGGYRVSGGAAHATARYQR